MKIIYRNVSQIIETSAWQKKTKPTGATRSVVLGSCVDLATKTSITAKIKILSNTDTQTSCNVYLCVGANDDVDQVSSFFIGPQTMDLTVGAVTTLSGAFTIRPVDIENNRDLKIGTVAIVTGGNPGLSQRVSWEVEYVLS